MISFIQWLTEWEDDPNQETHQTRYHVLKTKHWEEAKAMGHLDPKKNEMGHGIWTSTHPVEHYVKKFGGRPGIEHDETELAITLHKRHFHKPPGGGSADRVTKIKVPLKHIKEVPGPRRPAP